VVATIGCLRERASEVVNRLRALRGPGESYSDVILKLVERGPRRALTAMSRHVITAATVAEEAAPKGVVVGGADAIPQGRHPLACG